MDNKISGKEKRREDRTSLITKVEFHALKDLLEASSIDISKSGIKLHTEEPLKIKLRFKHNGILVEKIAKMTWVKCNNDTGASYGFEFIKPETITPGNIPEE